mgnify:CR=1 FL=1
MYGVIEQHPDFKEYASPQIPLNVTLSPPTRKRKAPAKEVTVDEKPPTEIYFDNNEDDGKRQCPCCQKWYIKSHKLPGFSPDRCWPHCLPLVWSSKPENGNS